MSIDTASSADRQSAALAELAQFPLLDALYGRRARRISLGSTIPDGPLAYESPHDPMPLSELERIACADVDGGHHRLALLDHPQRHLRRPHGELRGGSGWAHLPVRGGLPDLGAVLHRRLRHLHVPHARRRCPGGPGRGGDHSRADARAPRAADREALRQAHRVPARGALLRGPQHLVRERARLAAGDPGRRPRAAHAGRDHVPDPERLLHHGRRERPGDPRDREVPRAGGRGRRLPAHVLRPVHAGRDHRRAGHQLLRRDARAPGDGAGRLDVRRHRPLLDAGRLRRPGHPRARLPLRRGRALVRAEPDRPRGRVRGVLPAALPRHGRRRGGALRAQVRRRAARTTRTRRARGASRRWCARARRCTTSASASA